MRIFQDLNTLPSELFNKHFFPSHTLAQVSYLQFRKHFHKNITVDHRQILNVHHPDVRNGGVVFEIGIGFGSLRGVSTVKREIKASRKD